MCVCAQACMRVIQATPVVGLFFEAGKTKEISNEVNLYKFQVQFTSEFLVPLKWIHPYPTATFSKPIFVPNI